MSNNLYQRIEHLKQLTGEEQPAWGIMTPHHMIEHLSATHRISNGKMYLPLWIDESEIPARMAFLYSDKPFQKNLTIGGAAPELRPLKTANLTEAIALLEEMLRLFDAHYEANPNDCPIHPLFGPLNQAQWIQFHNRHWDHHFGQFNLL